MVRSRRRDFTSLGVLLLGFGCSVLRLHAELVLADLPRAIELALAALAG
jgi:hypothetical protein